MNFYFEFQKKNEKTRERDLCKTFIIKSEMK